MILQINGIDFIRDLEEISMIHDKKSYDNIKDHAVSLGDSTDIRECFDINLTLTFDQSDNRPAYMDLDESHSLDFSATCSFQGELEIHGIMGIGIDILNKYLDLDDLVDAIKNNFDIKMIGSLIKRLEI